uniref:Uncharacterized protein n=1 Tax=Otus sunia TaxID=257818 RepID=A0A8C8AC26_9STRI
MAALISVCDFVRQAQEDLSSPTTSAFASHMGRCKATANSLEEVSRGEGPQGAPRGVGGAVPIVVPQDLHPTSASHCPPRPALGLCSELWPV